jgi:hypothetical protein
MPNYFKIPQHRAGYQLVFFNVKSTYAQGKDDEEFRSDFHWFLENYYCKTQLCHKFYNPITILIWLNLSCPPLNGIRTIDGNADFELVVKTFQLQGICWTYVSRTIILIVCVLITERWIATKLSITSSGVILELCFLSTWEFWLFQP